MYRVFIKKVLLTIFFSFLFAGYTKKLEQDDYKVLCYTSFYIDNNVNSTKLLDKIKFIIKPIAIIGYETEEDFDFWRGRIIRKKFKIIPPINCTIGGVNLECSKMLEQYLPIGLALFRVSNNSYEKIIEVDDYPVFDNIEADLPFNFLPFAYGKALAENINLDEPEFLVTNDVNLSKRSKQFNIIENEESIKQFVEHYKEIRRYELGVDPREIIKPYYFYGVRLDKDKPLVIGQFEVLIPNLSREYITLSYEIVQNKVEVKILRNNKLNLNKYTTNDTLFSLPKVIEVFDIDSDGQNEILCTDSTNLYKRYIYFKRSKDNWVEYSLCQETF